MIKAIRGMNDVLPGKMLLWEKIFNAWSPILKSYGYAQVRTPVLESTELFERAVGETTDIVEKEMYTFADRNGDHLTLRPEGTASCVRMGIEQGLFYHQTQKWWYQGPMYRHERPQRGRYREFFQLGVEAFGFDGPHMDAEMIALSFRLLESLGLADSLQLQLNTIATPLARQAYRAVLIDYFSTHLDSLDADSQNRLHRNPFRILDSKDPKTQALVQGAPAFEDYWDEPSRQHFEKLQKLLDGLQIPYVLNSHLVRGLDYYHRTVFEWVTHQLGSQSTVCAGGRYDGLVALLGGQSTPAVGFAIGLERIMELVEMESGIPETQVDVYLIGLNEQARSFLSVQVEQWRRATPDRTWLYPAQEQALKSQLKKAHAVHARFAVISGLSEAGDSDSCALQVKDMGTGEQWSIEPETVASIFEENIR